MKQLLIASNNEGKIKEIKKVFSGLDYEIISMKEKGLNLTIIEDQPDFAGNSFKKASEVSKQTGEIVLADDSGLEVEVLGNKPGVLSARFAGEYATDQENNEKLLLLLKDVPNERRRARFRCVMTMYWPDGFYIQTEGTCHGRIGFVPKGSHGFGYDPLFILEGFEKTMAQLTIEEKNKISHRALALKALLELLLSKTVPKD
ncbi:MAG: RdgB/HAM1 family non-canonical purine NTP pyrophosphatase [Caldicoprobacterales bacterium]|jgi:XTP/dITP diphosphohydrolase|nr:RdgB/HAM1 family non-canonical purine NTP pyrophosphatase [Clostridiales bacterium]